MSIIAATAVPVTESEPRSAHGSATVAAPTSAPSWAAVAAWGAGLVELALGAGALTGADGSGAARGAGTALVILGLASLVWGVATLMRGRLVTPRFAIGAALAGMVATAVALMADPSRTSVIAVVAASVLLLACSLGAAHALRTGTATDAGAPRLSVLFVTAVIVAGVVTPALGATEAGRLAPDHGEHSVVDPGHH
ncbi:hypothetical protein [Microbacterium sp. 2FI]|uniref:hypothetical protein n=1 Tax=Microbacterium sp. 2FI TaxID=2502193 RepID=UPI0010F60BDA|nr:hypothetical protein [Microbacterium sp. 2FI]